jgi:ubiquinone biosynthesis protein COQ9
MKKDPARQKILNAILAQVPFDGWTEDAYARGVEQAGITRGEADVLFAAGLRDVIDLFGETTDAAMKRKIKAEPGFTRLRVREKIAFGVRARLEALMPHREAMRRLIYWYAMPLHAPLGLKRLYKTVDLIWRAGGDTSTDFNFYTKRMLLAGVLKATMLFWFDDETPGCQASWEFLDRRIGEVLKVGKTISVIKEWKPAEVFEMLRQRMKRA